MKNVFKKVAILSISFVLVACGAETGSNSESTGSDNGETIEIEYWHTMEGVNASAMEDLVNDFNEGLGAEEGIHVTSVFQEFMLEDKLSTLYQSNDQNSFPNVTQIYSSGIPIIKEFENTISMDSMYEAGEDIITPREDLVDSTVRAFSYDNEMIAMPFNTSSILLYYNVDAFNEAGIEKEPETIEELAEVTEALTLKEGDNVTRHGLNVQVKRYQLLNWIGGQGEFSFFGNNEGGRVGGPMSETIMGEDGTLDNFLYEWEKVINTGGLKEIDENMNEEFALGTNAMAIMSSARQTKIADLNPDFEWAVANLPKVNATDTGGTAVGGGSVAMFDKDEEENRASWIFSQYLASPEVQAKWSMASGYLPTNSKTEELSEFKNYLDENPNFLVALEQMKNSHPYVQEPFDNISSEIDTIVDEYMLKFTNEGMDKKEVHDGMVNDLNNALTEYVEANL